MDRPPSRAPGRRDAAVAALAVLLGFVLFSTGGPPAEEPGAGRAVLMVVLAVAMGAPLAWRRSHPEQVAAAVVAVAVVYAVTLAPVPPFALWFALFAVVVHASPPRRAATAGVLVAAGVVLAVVAGPVVHGRAGGGVLPALLLTVVVGLTAALVRTERGRLEALRQRAASLERERDAAGREAAAEERLRIARDLHDLVGHGLSAVAVQSSTARVLLDSGDVSAASDRLRAVEASTRTALREMRQMLDVLRDDVSRVPSPGLAEVGRLVDTARETGLDVTLDLDDDRPVPAAVGLAVYRIVQESLTNVRRHAPGSCAEVRVRRGDDEVEVAVRDSGGRRPRTGDTGGGGHGLLGVRERVAALGGAVTAGPVGTGWEVRAVLPVDGGPR